MNGCPTCVRLHHLGKIGCQRSCWFQMFQYNLTVLFLFGEANKQQQCFYISPSFKMHFISPNMSSFHASHFDMGCKFVCRSHWPEVLLILKTCVCQDFTQITVDDMPTTQYDSQLLA